MSDKPEEVGWDEAFSGGQFVDLPVDEPKTLVIKNWKLVKVKKFDDELVELQADCVNEDGEEVEKTFNTSSNRLKKKLRPMLEGKKPEEGAKVQIIRVGEKFNTQYSVKELTL